MVQNDHNTGKINENRKLWDGTCQQFIGTKFCNEFQLLEYIITLTTDDRVEWCITTSQ